MFATLKNPELSIIVFNVKSLFHLASCCFDFCERIRARKEVGDRDTTKLFLLYFCLGHVDRFSVEMKGRFKLP